MRQQHAGLRACEVWWNTSQCLPPDRGSDEAQLALLEPETRELIAETERLHQRIARLDEAWRQHFEMNSPARAFQERIGR